MIFKGIKTYPNGIAVKCPVCCNEEVDQNHLHCKICGTFIQNRCAETDKQNGTYHYSQADCGKIADGNARYCTHCGNETTFYQLQLLQNWYANQTHPKRIGNARLLKAVNEAAAAGEDDDLPF